MLSASLFSCRYRPTCLKLHELREKKIFFCYNKTMLNRRLWLLAAVLFMSWFSIVVPGSKAAAEEGCVTSQCHSALLKGSTVHPVAESCDNCHQSVTTPHPQKGKKTFKLLQDPPALCFTCHPPFGQKHDIHPPVKDGMCTSCHNPHSSNEAKLLVQPLKELCLTCHADKVDFKNVHGPTSAGDCTACHNPHESDNEKLLIKAHPDLCFTCHVDMQDVMNKKDVHPALLRDVLHAITRTALHIRSCSQLKGKTSVFSAILRSRRKLKRQRRSTLR